MLIGVRNYLRGSLEIDIRGAAVERFLNLCAIHGVAFWDMQTLDVDHFTAWVSVGGYVALRPYARRTGCRICVRQKCGVPFWVRRFNNRWGLWVGTILGCIFICYLSGFVWTIEVQGCTNTTETEILEMMESVGLKTGIRKSECNLREMRNDVMLMSDKLSYFTVNFTGTHAIIEVLERETPAESPEAAPPCNVVSDLTGVVLRLRVRRGNAQIKVGDTLQPGDLIASGVIVNENDDTEITLLHAEAEADLRTWYTLRCAVPKELQLLSTQTVNWEQRYFLFGKRRFHLGIIEKSPVSWYDKLIKTHYLHLHDHFRWPIGLERQQIVNCGAETAVINRDALAQSLQQRMLAQLEAAKPNAEIVHTTFTLEQTAQGAWLGVLKVELVETTGQEVFIE